MSVDAIVGASIVAPSQPTAPLSSTPGLPTTVRPSVLSCCERNSGALPTVSPSDFQSRYARPSLATNGLGSIDPPLSRSHTSGPADASENGPAGPDALATEMHWSPDEASRTA